jgi:hypothetical protein
MSEPMLLTLNKLVNAITDQRGHLAHLAFYESWTFVPRSRQGRSLPVAIFHKACSHQHRRRSMTPLPIGACQEHCFDECGLRA